MFYLKVHFLYKVCNNNSSCLAHFMPLVSFYTPWKYQKTSSFLIFSGGIERDQWHKTGQWQYWESCHTDHVNSTFSQTSRTSVKKTRRFLRLFIFHDAFPRWRNSYLRITWTATQWCSYLKICSKFSGEHPRRSAISIKLQSNFIEIALLHGCSPVHLLHIFRTPFPKNTSGWLLLEILLLVEKLHSG